MDPGFFADPDPGFWSPDPSIYKAYVILRFWRSLTKQYGTVLRVLDMKYTSNIYFSFYPSFRNPDPDSEKKSDPDPRKKTRIRNTAV